MTQVYYGQENYLTGGNDPNNREALWDHGYNGNDLIKTLNKLRSTEISKNPKYVTTRATYLYNDSYQLFYQKGNILVGLNGQGEQRNIPPYELTVQKTTYSAADALIEILSCANVTPGAGGVTVTMQNGAPVVLYPKSKLIGTGICGF